MWYDIPMSTPEADLLKVAADAGLDEIKRAYRKAALAHHPDHNPHPDAARHFRRITEAYRLLAERALSREPRPRREPPLGDRVKFLLADVKVLLRRWPQERWLEPVDGLPAGVWVTSALEVLARRWPGAPDPKPQPPTAEGIAQAVAAWMLRLKVCPLPRSVPKAAARALEAALQDAELRVRAIDRPPRRRPI